eukprot:5163095-Prymnesium_polylepis.1
MASDIGWTGRRGRKWSGFNEAFRRVDSALSAESSDESSWSAAGSGSLGFFAAGAVAALASSARFAEDAAADDGAVAVAVGGADGGHCDGTESLGLGAPPEDAMAFQLFSSSAAPFCTSPSVCLRSLFTVLPTPEFWSDFMVIG